MVFGARFLLRTASSVRSYAERDSPIPRRVTLCMHAPVTLSRLEFPVTFVRAFVTVIARALMYDAYIIRFQSYHTRYVRTESLPPTPRSDMLATSM